MGFIVGPPQSRIESLNVRISNAILEVGIRFRYPVAMTVSRTVITALLAAGLAVAADPFVGTWKPNLDKWKDAAYGRSPRKSELTTWELVEKDTYRVSFLTMDGKVTVRPDGTPRTEIRIFDGKEHDGAIPQRIDERHLKSTVKGAKGTSIQDFLVSEDGKTLTIVRKGTATSTGNSLEGEVMVYDKQ